MQNHWLNLSKNRKTFQDIDALFMEIWGEGGTFGDFILALNDQQMDLLMKMKLADGASDVDEMELAFSLVKP